MEIDDMHSIYNIQNIVIDNFKEEKGYFLPFKKETYLRIVDNHINDGEIYGAFLDGKMIAWIFLSVSNRMKELKQMIPNLEGSCADIDGVIVLPEYRGNGLQKILVKHLKKTAREKGIKNIIAEVTFGNVYSLRNLNDLGYEEKTWYQKDKNIKRYILLKKLEKLKMNNTIKPIIFDLDNIRRKAENGDKFACYILGRSYDSEENGAEQSFEKAMY